MIDDQKFTKVLWALFLFYSLVSASFSPWGFDSAKIFLSKLGWDVSWWFRWSGFYIFPSFLFCVLLAIVIFITSGFNKLNVICIALALILGQAWFVAVIALSLIWS